MANSNGSCLEVNFELDPTRDIVIKLLPGTNNIRIIAPMQDKIYCLGLIELAKQAIISFKPPESSAPTIVGASASDLNKIPAPEFETRKR